MAFARGEGSKSCNPLGMTVVGGLTVSTLVTLVLVPTIYSLLARFKKKARARV